MKRENLYLIFKVKDCVAALTKVENQMLSTLAMKVANWRLEEGKRHLQCVVVESDWPEYEPTWKAIEERVDNERKAKQILDPSDAPKGCRAEKVKEGEVTCGRCIFCGHGGCGDRKHACYPDRRADGCHVIFVKLKKRKRK